MKSISILPLLISAPIILFTLTLVVYNNISERVLAQEPELFCESPEIPVGAATDATFLLAEELLSNTQTAVNAALAQIAAAEQLMELPEQCKAENCVASCDTLGETIKCGSDYNFCSTVPLCESNPRWTKINPNDTDPNTGNPKCTRYGTRYSCRTNPCSGDPCPREEINATVDAITANHEAIKTARENIEDLLVNEEFDQEINGKNLWEYCPDKTKNRLKKEGVMKDETLGDLVLCLLDESRRALSACTTPAGVDPLEESRGVLTCSEAGYFGALSDKQMQECYPGNFYCCYFK